jgi:predicted nucleic acid-binding protein
MPLDVPAGARVFLDSTIFHYAFVSFPGATPQCMQLLTRIADRDLSACVSIPVLNDAVHKVMCSEAVARFSRARAGLVNWMKSNPDRVRELTHADAMLRLVEAMPVEVLSVDPAALRHAQQMVQEHGLLASDALIAALMQRHRIAHLATNDDDFDRIPGLVVWKPR